MKRYACLLLSSLILSACAMTSADLTKTYELIKPVGAPYSRVLVIGAHPERGVRRQLEETLVDALREDQIDAISGSSVIARDARPGPQSVATAEEDSRADAVLVSRWQDVSTSAMQSEAGPSSEAPTDQADNLLDFFRDGYGDESPASEPTVNTLVMAVDLFRTADGMRIWSVESAAIEKPVAADAIARVAASVRRQLQKDELIGAGNGS